MKTSAIISFVGLAMSALAFPKASIPGTTNTLAAIDPQGPIDDQHAFGELLKLNVTPHVQYGSSVGVLGCKINTNRVAYWPSMPSCDKFCIKLSNGDRSVHVMHIDQSGGANDISYDAWNILFTGHSVTEPGWARPGGGVEVDAEYVSADECRSLITDGSGKLPLAAANGMNWLTSCLGETWVGKNYQLHNIQEPVCHHGHDEKCDLPPPYTLPTCPHTLGDNPVLTNPSDHKVVNYLYPTGEAQEAP